MADIAGKMGTPVYDEAEDNYDSKYGKSTLADTQKPTNLSEGSNKPSPEKTSFRITQS